MQHKDNNWREKFLLESMNLSRRSKNVLLRNNIKNLDDLLAMDLSNLRRLPNCGKKSADEIKATYYKYAQLEEPDIETSGILSSLDSELYDYSLSYIGLSSKYTNRLYSHNIKTLEDLNKLSMGHLNEILSKSRYYSNEKVVNQIKIFENNTSLHEFMKENISKGSFSIAAIMDKLFFTTYERHKDMLINRLFHGYTLEECGKMLGVTRERIRQIESKFIKQFKLESSFESTNIIKDYLEKNSVIKNVFELEKADPIFMDISKYILSARKPNVFFNTLFKKHKLANWEKIEFEYRIYNRKLFSAEEIISSYNLNSENHFKLPLYDSIKSECLLAGRSDVCDYVYKRIRKKFNSTPVMARYSLARLRYKNIGMPIKTDAIISHMKDEFDYDAREEKRAIGALFYGRDDNNEEKYTRGLYPYGKNSFIFAEDAFDINFAKKVVKKVIEILSENVGRQFNLNNILKKLLNQEDIKALLNKEKISMTHNLLQVMMRIHAYDIDSKVVDHGRLLWSISDSEINTASATRIEKYPLVLKILKENGSPMELADIQKEVSKHRGSNNFQIHTTKSTPNVILVSWGVWGLRDRDIKVTQEQEKKLITEIVKTFKSKKKIIDVYDILKFKKSINIDPTVKCYQIAKMLNAHIPVGRRRTPDKVIFLQKCSRNDLNKFAIYSIDISDDEVDEYINNLSLENLPLEENAERTSKSFWPLKKACKFFIKNEIRNQSQYIKWRSNINSNINKNSKKYLPQLPEKTYKNRWLGWNRLDDMI